MPGFGEGFLQGLQGVSSIIEAKDRAEAERRKQDIDQEQFNKSYGLQQAQAEAQNKHQANMEGLQARELESTDKYHNRSLDIQENKDKAEADYRNQMVKNDADRVSIARQAAASNAAADAARINASNAEIGLNNYKLEQEKKQSNIKDAASGIMEFMSVDQNGKPTEINVPPGQESRFINYAHTLNIGIPTMNTEQNMRDYSLLSAAAENPHMVNPEHHPEIIQSANRVLSGVINQNLGKKSAETGNPITKVEISGIHPVHDDKGQPIPGKVYIELREQSKDKNGNDVWNYGPLTEGRNDDPKAKVKAVNLGDILKTVHTQATFDALLSQDPNQKQRLNNAIAAKLNQIFPKKHENSKGYQGIVITDKDNNETVVPFNKDTGEISAVGGLGAVQQSADQAALNAAQQGAFDKKKALDTLTSNQIGK
jgi:hypothetical protein